MTKSKRPKKPSRVIPQSAIVTLFEHQLYARTMQALASIDDSSSDKLTDEQKTAMAIAAGYKFSVHLMTEGTPRITITQPYNVVKDTKGVWMVF
ncbi:unnamed protein product [marine sediment metagenome]|uniref:Uncharacterized protein n=1 Tax=marine sediment metagenome TaxID=412755 RepID=X0X2T1_9ZZZZ